MTTKRKIWIGVALIIAILIFTNPSENKFKQFIDFEKPGDFKKRYSSILLHFQRFVIRIRNSFKYRSND